MININWLFISILLLLTSAALSAQVLITPISGTLSGVEGTLSFSTGEVATTTLQAGTNITQGFQQPNIITPGDNPCDGDNDPKCLIDIPTGITVNGDGVNDLWILDGLNFFPDNEVFITNRWGEQVFDAAPYNNDWGGQYNGKDLPQGTYYYLLIVADGNGNESKLTGSIHIIR